jgi:hypothetical protein
MCGVQSTHTHTHILAHIHVHAETRSWCALSLSGISSKCIDGHGKGIHDHTGDKEYRRMEMSSL